MLNSFGPYLNYYNVVILVAGSFYFLLTMQRYDDFLNRQWIFVNCVR